MLPRTNERNMPFLSLDSLFLLQQLQAKPKREERFPLIFNATES